MLSIGKQSRAARPTLKIASGSLIYCVMDCSKPVSFHRPLFVNCAISPDTARVWFRSGRQRSIEGKKSGKLRKQLPQLQQALDGRVQAHHRLLLKHLLAHIIFLEETLEQLQQEIEQHLCPFEETMTLLMNIPGIAALAAAAILAEIGDH